MNKNKFQSSRKKNPVKPPELDPSIIVCPKSLMDRYIRYGSSELDTYTFLLRADGAYTTDGGGVNAVVWSNNPTVAANWAGAAAVFDEYRVLQLRVEFDPIRFNGQLIAQAPIASVTDMDTATALTGYSLAAQYSSDTIHPGGVSWVQNAYMSGPQDSGFVSTASPVANFWIKTYTAGNTASTTIGRATVCYLVQFRGKGI
jgi:hypothetical protein